MENFNILRYFEFVRTKICVIMKDRTPYSPAVSALLSPQSNNIKTKQRHDWCSAEMKHIRWNVLLILYSFKRSMVIFHELPSIDRKSTWSWKGYNVSISPGVHIDESRVNFEDIAWNNTTVITWYYILIGGHSDIPCYFIQRQRGKESTWKEYCFIKSEFEIFEDKNMNFA